MSVQLEKDDAVASESQGLKANLNETATTKPVISNNSNVVSISKYIQKVEYNLGKATPTHAVPEKARLALEKSAGKVGAHPYGNEIEGIVEVRKSVADYINATLSNVNLKAADVIITNGAVEATSLLLLLQQNKFPGSNVLVPGPYYNVYNSTIYQGRNIIPAETTKESRFLVTPKMLDSALKWNPNIKTIILDSGPTNPSGAMYTLAEVKALAAKLEEIVTAHPNVNIVLDEVCKGLEYEGKKHHSIYEHASPKLRQNLSLVYSASKLGSMSYDRIGAFISDNKQLISEMVDVKKGFNMASNEPAQRGYGALLDEFRENPKALRTIARDYQGKAEYVISRLDKIGSTLYPNGEKAIIPVRPDGMFTVWSDFSGLLGKPVPQEYKKALNKEYITNSQDIANLLKEVGVIVFPGTGFNKPGTNSGNGFLRFSAPLAIADLAKAMDAVDGVVNSVVKAKEQSRAEAKSEVISTTLQTREAGVEKLSATEERLKQFGITLPDKFVSPIGLYLPVKFAGKDITLSGVLSHQDATGDIIRGKVSEEKPTDKNAIATEGHVPLISPEIAKLAARNAAIEILSILKHNLKKVGKTLDDLQGIKSLNVFVNVGNPQFTKFPEIANGASEVFLAAFGNEVDGKAARTVLGAASLPGGAAVEISSSFTLKEKLLDIDKQKTNVTPFIKR